MDINKIQSILESLPDQDIARYAQAPSPQVPQVLAQMELQRRATIRQASQMKGAPGMFAGGPVRRFEEGGLTAARRNYGNRQAREEALLEEAKRNRSAQMKPNSDAFKERAGQVVSDVGDMIKAGVGFLIPDAIEENYARQQALRDPAAAEAARKQQSFESLMAQAEQMPEPGLPAVSSGGASGSFGPPATGAVNQAGALPPVPGAQPGSPPGAQPGPAPTARPAGPKLAASPLEKGLGAVAPAAQTVDPNADPRMAQMEAALKQKGEVLTQGLAQEIAARREALVPVNEEKERNRQIYTALGQWGTALLLTRNYGVANATALQTLQKEIGASEEKRKEFKKAALDIALAEIKGRMESAGMPVERLKELNALGSSIKKEFLDERDQVRKDRDTESNIKYRETAGRAALINANANVTRAAQGGSGGGVEGTGMTSAQYAMAMSRARDDALNQIKDTPEYMLADKATQNRLVDTRAAEIVRQDVLRRAPTGDGSMVEDEFPGWGMPTVK